MWSRRKQSSRGGAPALVLTLVLIGIVAAGAFMYFRNGPATTPKPVTDKKGTADYSADCDKLHNALNQGLLDGGFVVSDSRTDNREVSRKGTDGKILWRTRSLLVNAPAGMSADVVRKYLETVVAKVGGVVYGAEQDSYSGYQTTRIDVGFKDILGGETLTLITDKIYVMEAKKSVPVGPRVKANPADKAEIALIIDDFGYKQEMIAEFAAIRKPFTWAVIPNKAYSQEAATKGLTSGHQILLHLPMEPLSGTDSEPGEITVTMTGSQIRENVEKALTTLPGVVGVNNHQGSKATADRRIMGDVIAVLKQRGLFFVDSRTSGQSVASDTARQNKIRTTDNDLFIDGMSDEAYVKKQLRSAGDMALRLGVVTIIGHARPATAAALREVIPELEAKGIRFVFVSQIVK